LITNQFPGFSAQTLFGNHICSGRAGIPSNPRANDLEKRLIQFAIDIVKLVGHLPQNFQAKHIANQILRSGTAPAPNYGEARAAESRADFIHKLKIALKELNETAVWLRILRGSFDVDADLLGQLVGENTELCKIIVASVKTARRNDGRCDQCIKH
jgi:four helix bundle protein